MEKVLKKNLLIFFSTHILEIASVSLVHSVLTILLLNKGLSLSNIVTIQTAYSLAILIFEFPSGVIGDTFSRKNLNIVSKFFLLTTFFLILFFNSFLIMICAWFFYGIYAALNSGTLENDIINQLKINQIENGIVTFLKYSNIIRLLTMITSSFIGAFIYYKIGINIYIISIIFITISLFLTLKFKSSQSLEKKHKVHIFQHIKESLKEVEINNQLKIILFLSFSSQIFFQTHFQLWQGLFLEKNINEKVFPYMYIIFQLIGILAYNFPIKNSNKKFSNVLFRIMPIFVLFPLTLFIKNDKIFIFMYCLLVLIFTIIEFISEYLFSKTVSIKSISSLTSLNSVISRIGSICILLISSFLINYFTVLSVVIFNFTCSIVFILIILFFYQKLVKKI